MGNYENNKRKHFPSFRTAWRRKRKIFGPMINMYFKLNEL